MQFNEDTSKRREFLCIYYALVLTSAFGVLWLSAFIISSFIQILLIFCKLLLDTFIRMTQIVFDFVLKVLNDLIELLDRCRRNYLDWVERLSHKVIVREPVWGNNLLLFFLMLLFIVLRLWSFFFIELAFLWLEDFYSFFLRPWAFLELILNVNFLPFLSFLRGCRRVSWIESLAVIDQEGAGVYLLLVAINFLSLEGLGIGWSIFICLISLFGVFFGLSFLSSLLLFPLSFFFFPLFSLFFLNLRGPCDPSDFFLLNFVLLVLLIKFSIYFGYFIS